MSGTKEGGLATADTLKEKYGPDYYAKIGAMGGKVKGAKGFAVNKELARLAGAKGGRISRRGKGRAPIETTVIITQPKRTFLDKILHKEK